MNAIGFIPLGLGIPLTVMFVLMVLDLIFKFRWTCKAFGWHDGNAGGCTFDGASVHARCSKCSKEVMQDSQGNWF